MELPAPPWATILGMAVNTRFLGLVGLKAISTSCNNDWVKNWAWASQLWHSPSHRTSSEMSLRANVSQWDSSCLERNVLAFRRKLLEETSPLSLAVWHAVAMPRTINSLASGREADLRMKQLREDSTNEKSALILKPFLLLKYQRHTFSYSISQLG